MTASAFFGYNLAKNYVGQLKWVFEVLVKTYKLEETRPNLQVVEYSAYEKQKEISFLLQVDLFLKYG